MNGANENSILLNSLKSLRFESSANTSLVCLLSTRFATSSMLTSVICKRIFVKHSCNFVRLNKILEALIVKKCNNIDAETHLVELFSAVYSGENSLPSVYFNFEDAYDVNPANFSFSLVRLSPNIDVLNLLHNAIIKVFLPELLSCSGGLRTLDLPGINLSCHLTHHFWHYPFCADYRSLGTTRRTIYFDHLT